MNKNIEIELRGKIIASSLSVEDAITRIIHNFLYPKSKDKESRMIYFREIIIPLTFGKKKELLKKIFKTERYKNLISPILVEENIIGNLCQFKEYNNYTAYIITSLDEIIKDRNIIAHGYDMSLGFPYLASKGDIVLSNKTKMYKYSEENINDFYKKTKQLTYYLNLLHIKI